MRAHSSSPAAVVPPRLFLGLVVGLLLGGLLGPGCTPGSSRSPSSPDTTTAPAKQTITSSEESSAPSSKRSPAPSGSTRTVAQRLADASVEARIKQALVRERSLRPFTFSPEVVRGRVILRGDVDTREQSRHAERIVETLEGVERVTNQITVEGRPVSEADDASAPSSASDIVYHLVRRGDTLWEIAREYEVSVPHIRALNPHSASSLRPGERLRVR